MASPSRNRWRLLGVALLLVTLVAALGLWAGAAFADTPPAAAPTATVSMTGQGTVVGGEEASQLRLRMTASDGSSWLLEMALNPLSARNSSGDTVVYELGGSFTLGVSEHPLATGAASGTMDQNGNGDIRLTGSSGLTSLDVPFTTAGNGQISARVTGNWPALPVVQPAAASAAPPVNHFWWYLSRAAGLVSYILLFLSIAFGLGMRTNRAGASRRRIFLELHRFLAVLGLGFMGLHIAALLGDSYVSFNVAQLLLPADLPYRPLATAIGIFGMYAFVIVMLTFVARRWVGRKLWRVVHGGAILMFVLVLLHSITAGTDTVVPWVRWMYALTAGATVFLAISYYVRRRNTASPVSAAGLRARSQGPASR